MPRNIKALLCYLLQLVGGIIFLVVEKKDKFVRFHAAQSIVTFASLYILQIMCNFIFVIGGFLSFVISILTVVIMVIGMIKAYHNEMYKFPIVWDITKSIFFANENIDDIDDIKEETETINKSEDK